MNCNRCNYDITGNEDSPCKIRGDPDIYCFRCVKFLTRDPRFGALTESEIAYYMDLSAGIGGSRWSPKNISFPELAGKEIIE